MMAEDVRALLDHLELERADVMGYSMGARITAFLALRASRTHAFGDLRRARHQVGAWRRPAGNGGGERWRRPRSTT